MDNGNEEESCGNIAALFGEFVSHNGRMIESDGLEKDDIYVDFGDETREEICKEINQRVKEAAETACPRKGAAIEEINEQTHGNIQIKIRKCWTSPGSSDDNSD